jgi:hypothetical protein
MRRADVVLIEALKARHAGMKAQFAAAERAEDAQHAAEIATELEKAEKVFAELLRVADRLAALAARRTRPSRRRLVG